MDFAEAPGYLETVQAAMVDVPTRLVASLMLRFLKTATEQRECDRRLPPQRRSGVSEPITTLVRASPQRGELVSQGTGDGGWPAGGHLVCGTSAPVKSKVAGLGGLPPYGRGGLSGRRRRGTGSASRTGGFPVLWSRVEP